MRHFQTEEYRLYVKNCELSRKIKEISKELYQYKLLGGGSANNTNPKHLNKNLQDIVLSKNPTSKDSKSTVYVHKDNSRFFEDNLPHLMVKEAGMTMEVSDRYEAMPDEF